MSHAITRRRAVATSLLLGLLAVSINSQASEAPAATLKVEALVESVLAQNRGLDALQAAIQAADASIIQAGTLPDPVLTGAVAPQTIGGYDSLDNRGANVRIELSQQLPWPGKLDLQTQAAQFEARAADEDLAALRLQLAALTRSAYAEWHFAHRALAINANNQDLVEQLRSVAESRYAAGLAQQQDVLQAEVELQHLRHRQIQLQRLRRSLQARINSLLNQSPDTPLPAPTGKLALPAALPSYSELQDSALAAHPVLRQLEQRGAASRSRTSLAEKDFYPDFRVFTGYNGLWDVDEKRWIVGAGINLPIDRRKRRAAVDQAQAHSMRIDAELDDRRTQLLGALEQTLASAEEQRHTIALYEQELIPLTEENLSAARAEYGAGGGAFLDVITAEKLQLEARLALARARSDYFAALAQLQRWAGGELPTASAHLNSREPDHENP